MKRFGAKKAGKCDFLRESAHFREKGQNFAKFRLFGPEITFWAPRAPRTLVKRSAGVRIHFSGRKRGGGGGVYSLLSSPPHLLLSDSPPLTPPLLTSETNQYHHSALHLVALKFSSNIIREYSVWQFAISAVLGSVLGCSPCSQPCGCSIHMFHMLRFLCMSFASPLHFD